MVKTGDPEFYLEGLWYPIIIASVLWGMVYIKNKDEKTLTFKNTTMNQLKRVLGLVWLR
jgi:hypothetical protein